MDAVGLLLIAFKTIVSICMHYWQLIISNDYKKVIGRCCICPSVKFLMKCVYCIADMMKCVQCIADKMMEYLGDIIANLQEEDIISTPIQATDE